MFSKEIKQAEAVWKEKILAYLIDIYEGKWLPSHDISHHIRVWQNAIEILPSFSRDIRAGNTTNFIQELLIACYFHDTGLLIDPGFKHGTESSKICQQFLADHAASVSFNTRELFSAIEKHDEKVYSVKKPAEFQLLHKILTLADDMDAFGAIGAYRYAEIYLSRRIPARQIPELVLENAAERFQNLVQLIPVINTKLTDSYARLVKLYTPGEFADDPRQLVELINKELLVPRSEPYACFSALLDRAWSARITYFLQHFLAEWETENGADGVLT